MKNQTEKTSDTVADKAPVIEEQENGACGQTSVPALKKKKFTTVRAALMCLLIFTLICGVVYPISVTLLSQAAFPYEANGSQIVVSMPDGTQKVFGSELIGQNYENPEYMFGRVNSGAPSNLSPESEDFEKLLNERIAERKEKLAAIGYTDIGDIPSELLTSSGSGVDPHISPETAEFQIPVIVRARATAGKTVTEEEVRAIIKKYTEGRFLGVFGEKRVNVLLVNLALDGLL